MEKLLKLIENDATLSTAELALMLEREEGEIDREIKALEDDGVILARQTVIDWEKTGRELVDALIEVKVVPERNGGFDRVAEQLLEFPEVRSLYLMSGGFDLMLIIEGKTMREVAYFVARRLATLESVSATATHFVLKKYKEKGVIYRAPKKDERGVLPI